ncbi:MAG: PKD domain-containing protein [Bacteroidetes bacterium]|nr:MAG: PKD domain-containing protein [Bacteroidota bacterium]
MLQSSIDNGLTWQNVGAFGDPNNWYTDNSVAGLPGGSQEAWSGAGPDGSGGWVTARHALTGLNGQASVRLRIAFGSDFSVVDDGFAFDNIVIYNQLAADFGSVAITDPFGSLCSSSATPVSVQVTNYGTQTQSNIPVTVQISGAGTATLTGVVPGPLAPGDTATFAIGTFNSSVGGTFNFSTYTGLTGDVNFFNDSTSGYSVNIALVPVAPIPGPDSICAVAPVSFTLTAFSATSEIRWYDAPSGGNLLAVGDTLITPVLGTTTTYYAEAASPLSYGDFTLEDNTVGFGFYDNFFSEGLGFDALQPFTLNSVRVFPSSSGSISVNLLSSTGTLLETAVFPFGGTVGDTVLTLNWDIDAGNDYVINAGGTSLQFFGGLFRNFFGATFPYTQPGIVTIDGSATGSTFDYYFFYDWQITALGCPSGRVPVAATFLALTDVDLGADGAYCSGYELDAFDPTIVSYEWNNDPTINTPSITPTQTGLYTVEVVNNFGCVSADTIALIINPSPTVSLGADQTACGSVTLDAGNAGALFSWSNGATSQAVTISQSGTYSVVVTALGCTDEDTVSVTILPAPVVELGVDQTSCLPVTLNAGAGATSYLWSTGATTQTISVTPPSSGSTTVSVTVTGANGCASTDQVTVNAGVSPVVNLGADVTACDSTLLVSGISGVTYLWNTGATTQNLYAFSSGAYSVTVTNAQGCTDSDTVNATINLTPEALATFQNNNFDFTVNFVNQSTPATGATYSWDFGDGSAPSSDVNPVHTYTDPGSFLVILTVTNACGTDRYEFLVGGVSIDNEAFGRSLSIYPNPTDGLFSLLGEDMHAENLSIQVTDARGRIVYERTEENVFGAYRHEMNLSEAAEGVYNVRVSDGVNTIYKRVIRR